MDPMWWAAVWSLADRVTVVEVDGGAAAVDGQEAMFEGPEEGLRVTLSGKVGFGFCRS